MTSGSSRRLRAGVVGMGAIGRHHARVLSTMEGVQLVAAADPLGDQYAAVPGDIVVHTVDEVIATGVDLCVVAVPTGQHEEVALALAEAGVNTLVEKPLAPDHASAMRIARAFRDRDLVGAVGHIERYNPAIRAMRSRLESGQLGPMYQVATRRQGPYPPRVGDTGVVLDLASHDIDMTTFLTRAEFTSVSAVTAAKSGRGHEDLVAFLGRLADGTVSSHLVNWLSPLKERVVIVTGERGSLVADTLSADLTFFANGSLAIEWDAISMFRGVAEGDMTRFAIPKPEPLRSELTAFRDAVLGLEPDIVSMEEGASVVAVATAVLQAASSGAGVEITSTAALGPSARIVPTGRL